jgi:hypothetical protein
MKEREKKINERKEKERAHPIRLVPFEENFFCSLKKVGPLFQQMPMSGKKRCHEIDKPKMHEFYLTFS